MVIHTFRCPAGIAWVPTQKQHQYLQGHCRSRRHQLRYFQIETSFSRSTPVQIQYAPIDTIVNGNSHTIGSNNEYNTPDKRIHRTLLKPCNSSRALFVLFHTYWVQKSASYLPVVQPGGHLQEYPLSHSSWWDLTLSELNCCIIYLVCRSRKQLAAEISSDCSQPGGTWEIKLCLIFRQWSDSYPQRGWWGPVRCG